MIDSVLILHIMTIGVVLWIACGLFRKYRPRHFWKNYIDARVFYINRQHSKHKPIYTFDRKEIVVLILSLSLAIAVLLVNYSPSCRKHFSGLLLKISGLTTIYPLTVTIIGAVMALLCIYFFVHVKMYVRPFVIYSPSSDNPLRREFKWYIENRSIFDAVNINVSIYKCNLTKEGAISYTPLKLACSHIPHISGRWLREGNRCYVRLKPGQLKKKDIEDANFDFLEIDVASVHSLSNVTTISKICYTRYDFYYANILQEEIFAEKRGLPRVKLSTLRAQMQWLFMMARKYVTYAALIVFMLIVFENMGFYCTAFLNDMGHWLQESVAYLIILFSIVRYLMKQAVMPIFTDWIYKPYWLVI